MNIEWLKNKSKEMFYPVTNAKAVLIGESGKTVDDVLKISTSVVSGDTNLVTGDAVSKAIYTATNYEEGTFTPVVYNKGSTRPVSVKDIKGSYRRVGNICHIHISFQSNIEELCAIIGLPFDSSNLGYLTALPNMKCACINIGMSDEYGESNAYKTKEWDMRVSGSGLYVLLAIGETLPSTTNVTEIEGLYVIK